LHSYCGKGPHKAIHCRKRISDEADAKTKEDTTTAIKKKTTSNDKSDYCVLSNFTYHAVHSIDDWYADSGATQHMSGQRSLFRNFTPIKADTWFVNGIGGARLQVFGHGQIVFTVMVDGSQHSFSVSMVLYVPGLGVNLLSIAAVTEVGINAYFKESYVNYNTNEKTIIVGKRIGGKLYLLAITATKFDEAAIFHGAYSAIYYHLAPTFRSSNSPIPNTFTSDITSSDGRKKKKK
jgi:hypothetical protein